MPEPNIFQQLSKTKCKRRVAHRIDPRSASYLFRQPSLKVTSCIVIHRTPPTEHGSPLTDLFNLSHEWNWSLTLRAVIEWDEMTSSHRNQIVSWWKFDFYEIPCIFEEWNHWCFRCLFVVVWIQVALPESNMGRPSDLGPLICIPYLFWMIFLVVWHSEGSARPISVLWFVLAAVCLIDGSDA